MKKYFVIFSAVFYLVLASGLSISLHFCGGKLKNISFFSSGNGDGCCGSKKKSKGCCSEKSTFIKVQSDYFAGNNVKISSYSISSHIPKLGLLLFKFQNVDIYYRALNYNIPPVFYDNPIYLKHRVLII